ncbi:MAG: hypothetical protein IM539_05690 [Pseudanabaena sp. M046S1SP1A06QC]|nr:hypothetical protein [Pseudanabaena sp. M046S1SP1A06QC]
MNIAYCEWNFYWNDEYLCMAPIYRRKIVQTTIGATRREVTELRGSRFLLGNIARSDRIVPTLTKSTIRSFSSC